ncbi:MULTISPECIES: Asp-tRNA(Asn)/Glu-tRNA(Gln) amidotransferase subunit GatC [Brochothrix]|uniref:Aspartyl/glutamyl-tRNA(Asn/Gln) amidotransferase subunit C n=1 Tax=Brochothrix thermosphacta TaxID=2756 RepID=A0A1D2KBY5_BROTH|nr:MULTISPECIES: Asp-tRNA(Asn)/Glu-tRNA(Gln) amidotransferase subunit GatC [Brochothrix]SLM92458.1 Aspartyl-tRNA(Asn) amidotransferase subunit C amidotransferase subunit C [Brachybacterium faecium]ANZ94584.1 asparaginyl/glutamyl-tRNA amidotransferase subunit C [Brochothrix thermosphacta]ANZ97105.1 asparaginyl/glutamyl-tRNA amidotransferase subunit C [Brochothrix thermosphacta]ATF26530.1 Asp-tRNA(Asn)/Glu-tRNA(Gln) amidotransferase GatCAB subunit C [Brochothrix thermosphacta]EUJ37458.1 asparagi
MSVISKAEVEKVASLARLEITEAEAEQYATQLEQIINMVEKLNELDTENIKPTTHAVPLTNVLREDVAAEGLDRNLVLKNAPDSQDGYIKVPSIMD